ncbi:histidine phosphatase family protein [Cellulomonas sp. HZM]|uniref:histidine phosphatase family protein n=1 Tax=Cellulomonas sp. HZM TaxID=1454010 RepID=UPI00049399B7|nr:histidine phosphatase family protein [Cellulomonas sp. HZM]
MSAGTLLLWRHGRTAYNAAARLQGQIDIPLDDVGRWQARTAAAQIVERYEPTHIVVSDLGRAVETASFLARAAGIEAVVDPRVRERAFGEWEGLTHDELAGRWPEAFEAWRTGSDPAGVGAETRAQVAERAREAIEEHAASLDRSDTLVVVSHGAAIGVAAAALLGQEPHWRGLQGMHNAHWAELRPSSGDPSWRMSGYNLGPSHSVRSWNEGPSVPAEQADEETRDPS